MNIAYVIFKSLFVLGCLSAIIGIVMWANPREDLACTDESCDPDQSLWSTQTRDERLQSLALVVGSGLLSVLNVFLILSSKSNNANKKMRSTFERIATLFLLLTSPTILASVLLGRRYAPVLRTAALCTASLGGAFSIMYAGAQVRKRLSGLKKDPDDQHKNRVTSTSRMSLQSDRIDGRILAPLLSE